MADIKTREPSEGLRRRKHIEFSEGNFLKERVESILTENSYRSIQFIYIDKLVPFKNQKRNYFDKEKLRNLAETIKDYGIRQPLTVIQSETDGIFEIVSGERRFLAAKMVGLDKVPCIIIHDRKAAEEIAVIENVQRTDLHPIELGRAYSSLLKDGIISSQLELSKKIGVPRTQITEYVTFADLPENIASDLISHGVVVRRILRKVIKCSTYEEMEKVVKQAINKGRQESRKKMLISFFLESSKIDFRFYEDRRLSQPDLERLKASLKQAVLQIENLITQKSKVY